MERLIVEVRILRRDDHVLSCSGSADVDCKSFSAIVYGLGMMFICAHKLIIQLIDAVYYIENRNRGKA